MNKSKERLAAIGKELYRLANVGSSKAFNADLSKLEKLSGEAIPADELAALAIVGASTEEEMVFAESCLSAFTADE
jgi:hypothetical protein